MLIPSLAIMFGTALAVCLTAFLLRRHKGGRTSDLPKGVEMAIGAVSGLFVFSFAFLAVNAQGQLDTARKATLAEAGALKDVYFLARGLPPSGRDDVRQRVVAYTRSVISAEWPAMHQGHADEATVRGLDQLRAALYRIPVTDEDSRATRAEASQRLQDVYVARRERLAQKDAEVPPPILSLMVGSGVVTLVFFALFGKPTGRTHYFLLGVGAAGFAYMIYLVLALNHPYAGGVSIGPAAYEEALQRYGQLAL
ncbi:DUF4239 domain-containing protein [Streptomyces sp. AV19]|uniref:bestrophin-like domain n=1 Tax=Streptomyces sp. AV19 TaxID=2793068 RepID=UPI0018FE75E8|nr:DUF4239 domain-containing protein [Streptomyces sp. AV19]MBH1939017.1 DUF4239 domain-containing protein [Streptomyces sp. AV19]MDG4532458.1 DUF4239 domain-containing protein [Streptomyces sp. AV19]